MYSVDFVAKKKILYNYRYEYVVINEYTTMYDGVRKPQESDFTLSFDDALKIFLKPGDIYYF